MDTRRVGRTVVSKGKLRCHMAAKPTQKEQLQIHSSSSSCWKGLSIRAPPKKQLLEGTEGQGTPQKALESKNMMLWEVPMHL